MSLVNRTMTAATWMFSSIIVQAVLQIAVTSVLGHFIPPVAFGLFGITGLVIGIAGSLSQIGVGPAIVQRKDLTDQFISAAFIVSLGLGLVGFIAIWIIAPWVADFFGQTEVVGLLRASSTIIIISGFSTVSISLLQRELQFRKVAIINITSYTIGYGLIGCGLAITRRDAWAIVGASISQSLVTAILLLLISSSLSKITFLNREYKSLLTFSTGVSVAQIFNNIAYYLDNLIVGRFIGATALGLYQMAFQIMDLPRRFLGNVIDQILFVVMSRFQDDSERMRSGYLQSLNIANTILLPVTAVMIIAAPELVRVILGNNWTGVVLPLQILLTQVPLRASIRMADAIITATGKVYRLARYKIIYTIMIGVGSLLGVRWGIIGVAIVITGVVVINWMLMVWITLQIVRTPIKHYLSTWVSAVSTGIFVSIVTFLASVIIRQSFEKDFIVLSVLILVAALTILALVFIWPGIVGTATVRLILDYGKQVPLLSGPFTWMENHIFLGRVPRLFV